MKVRAIATAAERSNAIGTVELESTPHGLMIVYLGLASFQEGYAPPTIVSGTRVLVPYASVLEARLEGDRLYLSIEPRLTPHSRMLLAGFSGHALHQRELMRQRIAWRIAGAGMAVAGALLASLTAPRLSPEIGAAAAVLLGLATAVALLAMGWFAELRLMRAHDERVARALFVAELSTYLPSLGVGPSPRPPLRLPPLPDLTGIVPRTTAAVVILLSSGLLGLLLVGRWMVAREEQDRERSEWARRFEKQSEPNGVEEARFAARAAPPPPVPPASKAPPAPSAAPSNSAPAPLAELTGNCRCERAQSLLWADPIPKLGTLILSRRESVGGRRQRLEVDIAAVNNSAEELKEVTLLLEFFEQDTPDAEPMLRQRGVYFEGPLGPGEAIKWTVESRGSRFQVHNPITGVVGSHGEGMASADAIARLLKANHRPVRLHGAMLLAFLGDPRAREAALGLGEAQREDEAAYLARVVAATGELRVCDLGWSSPQRRRVEACVFNSGNEARSDLGLGVRVLESKLDPGAPLAPPPTVLIEGKARVVGKLPAGKGTRVQVELPSAAPSSAALEGHADRYDLLEER